MNTERANVDETMAAVMLKAQGGGLAATPAATATEAEAQTQVTAQATAPAVAPVVAEPAPESAQSNVYVLKKSVEWGGQHISSLTIADDVTPMMLENIDLDKLSEVGELTKAIAAITRQPKELIGILAMADWTPLARRAGEILGNSLTG